MGGHVRRYVADNYHSDPETTKRRRSLYLDGGGCAIVNDPLHVVKMSGWSVRVRDFDVEIIAARLDRGLEKPPKLYNGHLAIKVNCGFYIAVLRPYEARIVREFLRPLVDAAATRRAVKFAELAASEMIVTPYPVIPVCRPS